MMQDKEWILVNTFEALQRLDDSKNRAEVNKSVIDITGEEENGGSTSRLFECDSCSYKSSLETRFNQHRKDKHSNKQHLSKPSAKKDDFNIPCDVCDFVSDSTSNYMKHIQDNNDINQSVLKSPT